MRRYGTSLVGLKSYRIIGRNEYLLSTFSESTVPWVYSLQFVFKSTHHSWRYDRKCEWVFFSEHSVDRQSGVASYPGCVPRRAAEETGTVCKCCRCPVGSSTESFRLRRRDLRPCYSARTRPDPAHCDSTTHNQLH